MQREKGTCLQSQSREREQRCNHFTLTAQLGEGMTLPILPHKASEVQRG